MNVDIDKNNLENFKSTNHFWIKAAYNFLQKYDDENSIKIFNKTFTKEEQDKIKNISESIIFTPITNDYLNGGNSNQ